MADSVQEPDKAEPVVTPVKTVKTWRQVPIWGWVVGAIVLFLAIVGMAAACFSVLNHGSNRLIMTSRSGMMQRGFNNGQGQFSTGTGMRSGFGGRMMGGTGTIDSSTRVAGVITAVDGTTLTVAGDGTTTKVVVNDSTTYAGSSKPAAVNDTIVALGTKASDGTFTATSVRLSRQ